MACMQLPVVAEMTEPYVMRADGMTDRHSALAVGCCIDVSTNTRPAVSRLPIWSSGGPHRQCAHDVLDKEETHILSETESNGMSYLCYPERRAVGNTLTVLFISFSIYT